MASTLSALLSLAGWIFLHGLNIIDSLSYCQTNKGLIVWAYVIMPSHVHLIISRKGPEQLKNIMRDMKKYTAGKILDAIKSNQQESRRECMLQMFYEAGQRNSNNTNYQFWQQDNHPVQLSTNSMIEQRLNYLHSNPVDARIVNIAESFVFSSARQYAGERGLLKVSIIS